MFQDNPLAQLKQQLHSQTPRVEGIVKGTEKGFGFLEVDGQKSYFHSASVHEKSHARDRVIASCKPKKSVKSSSRKPWLNLFLSRFVGRVTKKDDRLSIIPDHPLLRDAIQCRVMRNINHEVSDGDWCVAEMRRHPLKEGDHSFQAEITEWITTGTDDLAPWWVTLARHNLEREAPKSEIAELRDEGLTREDLTALPFVTIDSGST